MVIRRQAEPKRPERPHREEMRRYTARLYDWLQHQSGLQGVPTFNAALTSKYMSCFTK